MIGILKAFVFFFVFVAIVLGTLVVVFDGKMPWLKKGAKQNNNNNNKGKDNTKTQASTKANGKGKAEVKYGETQDFLDFDDIEVFSQDNPMGLVVRDNKSEFIGMIEVFGLNYNLLSIEEREILEDSFGKLLNGIDYGIQIYVQSRKLNIDKYESKYDIRLDEIKKNIDSLTQRYNFLKENNEELDKLADMEIKINKLVSQYNYGIEIKEYMMERSKAKNILERKYYIVISHRYNAKLFEESQTYKEILNNAFFDVANKGNSLVTALQRAKLGGKMLSGIELAEVLYSAYNKSDSSVYKIDNAVKSQFSHLITTATAVELKTIARQLDDIEKLKEEEFQKLEELKAQAVKEQIQAEEDYYDLDIDVDDIDIDKIELEG
jgi:hypothetical protein